VPTDAEMTACLGALRTAPTQQQIQKDQQALTTSQSDLTKAFTLVITTTGQHHDDVHDNQQVRVDQASPGAGRAAERASPLRPVSSLTRPPSPTPKPP